ncbi:MAG TPA: hypothetical protein VGM03_11795 [Phycisphaerae bacterium]|jgi:metal-responsive CopG/Arc/MetJ family transcriptional regulator
MSAVKTAISIPRDVFDQMEQLAKRMRVPRSRLFTRAAQEFVARHAAGELTRQINRALRTAGETTAEKKFRLAARRHFSKQVEGTW